MARPSKLSPAQWREVERRSAEGEGARALGKEFGVDEAAIRRRVNPQTPLVRSVAAKLAEAQAELAALPISHQYIAINLADKLRNISASLAAAGELGAATAHRLHALANNEVCKIDDSDPRASIEALKGVAVLTRMGNDSAVLGMGLLAANKDIRQPGDTEIVSRIERAIVRPLVRHAQEVTTIENATDTDS